MKSNDIMRLLIIFGVLFLMVVCSLELQFIEYGMDFCDFCWMIIVDKQYVVELVMIKGCVYKFDVIECQV